MFRKFDEILSRELYEHYKETRTKVSKGANQYKLYEKCIAGLLSVMKELIVENENGLYLDKFGYFSIHNTGDITTRKVSLLKRAEIPIRTIMFEFLSEKLNKKYKFLLNKRFWVQKERDKNYSYKKHAVEYYIKNTK